MKGRYFHIEGSAFTWSDESGDNQRRLTPDEYQDLFDALADGRVRIEGSNLCIADDQIGVDVWVFEVPPVPPPKPGKPAVSAGLLSRRRR